MDGDFKMPFWGLAELGANAGAVSIAGSSNATGIHAPPRRLDFSVVDLKLGGPRVPASKRARTMSSGAQNVSCLVDGCGSDLGRCREYHRRHRVCEAHSKAPVVVVGGLEQRFCQQCSRFHLLVEFDEVKRSCRKRLDGHNRRRRKPPPESVSSGTVFPNHQSTAGAGFSPYPQIFPTMTAGATWPAAVKNEDDIYTGHPPMHLLHDHAHHHFIGKHFPVLDQQTALDPSPLVNAVVASAESSSSRSECALSLLSAPPRPLLPYSGRLGAGRYPGSCRQSNHAVFSCWGLMEDEMNAGSTVTVYDGSDAEMKYCEGLYGVGGERSSDGGLQALHFSWQ